MYVLFVCIYTCWKDIVFHFCGSKLFFSNWESAVATSAACVDGGILGKHQCCGAMGHCLSSYKLVFGYSSYRRDFERDQTTTTEEYWVKSQIAGMIAVWKVIMSMSLHSFLVENVAKSWNFVALMTDSICFCRKAKYMSKTFKNK